VPTFPAQPTPPSLSVSDATILHARIGALEARIQALEAMLSQSAEGVTIASTGNIVLKTAKDFILRAGRNISIEGRGGADVKVVQDANVTLDHEVFVRAGDHYQLTCGSAKIDARKSGDIEISGNRVTVKGSGDVTIKGQKILQN
jgi:type VI secretion system secreted protein VgrG